MDVSENEERTILATFDPITGLATYEREALDALLREVDTGEAALQEMLSELAARENVITADLNDINLQESDEVQIGQEQRILLLVPPEEYEDARRAILRLTEENRTWDVRFPK